MVTLCGGRMMTFDETSVSFQMKYCYAGLSLELSNREKFSGNQGKVSSLI